MFTLASLAPILVLVGRDRFALTAREVGYLFGLMGRRDRGAISASRRR